jgi:hypothetical protein
MGILVLLQFFILRHLGSNSDFDYIVDSEPLLNLDLGMQFTPQVSWFLPLVMLLSI